MKNQTKLVQLQIEPKMSIIVRKGKPKVYFIKFLYGAVLSPVESTWISATKKGNFILWPGLTSKILGKNLIPSIDTAKEYLQQEYQGLRSTKIIRDNN